VVKVVSQKKESFMKLKNLRFSLFIIAVIASSLHGKNAVAESMHTVKNQDLIRVIDPSSQNNNITKTSVMKEWTFMVYIAADNDLNRFSTRNLEDMSKVGSNKNLNIVAHLDKQGSTEKTKRLYVEKDKLVQVNYGQPSSFQKLDSGCETTLIDFCEWTILNYPAKHYALVLWNHGSGISDNVAGRLVNSSELFVFNPLTNMLELDRSITFFDFAHKKEKEHRGVCFSDTYNSFLTNQKLEFALKSVQQNGLKGKKFDIIGYDACLMAMTEVADLISPYADIAVFSQEVELGAGWKYDEVLRPFNYSVPTPEQFAVHIVAAFNTAYQSITQDYTFSAVSLSKFTALERTLDSLSGTLIEMLKYQQGTSLLNIIRAARSKNYCTHFSQPTYIDLDHFLANLFDTLNYATLTPEKEYLKSNLRSLIDTARLNLAQCVLAHVEGRNLARARGLSIYYPARFVDSTYTITPFARKNRWLNLISMAI
jgi:hypothetical protein